MKPTLRRRNAQTVRVSDGRFGLTSMTFMWQNYWNIKAGNSLFLCVGVRKSDVSRCDFLYFNSLLSRSNKSSFANAQLYKGTDMYLFVGTVHIQSLIDTSTTCYKITFLRLLKATIRTVLVNTLIKLKYITMEICRNNLKKNEQTHKINDSQKVGLYSISIKSLNENRSKVFIYCLIPVSVIRILFLQWK
jgi:hypothetical protein